MKFEKADDWTDFPAEVLDRYAHKPIFIVGSPRSGTTLMRSVIDAHPEIFCPPCETFLFHFLNPIFNGFVWRDHYENLPFSRKALVRWLRRFATDLFANLGEKAGKQRWAEKTPSHVRFMDLISETFPEAQFIHMIRNGHDVVRSLMRVAWGSKDVGKNARQWVDSVKSGRKSGRLLSPQRYLEIRYDELTADPQGTLENLCRFLDVAYSPRMLDYHLPENNSWGQSLLPLQRPEKTGKYERLSDEDMRVFQNVAGPLMAELGYSP